MVEVGGTSLLAAPASNIGRPAVTGSDYLQVYATGLGALQNAPKDGFPAPFSPLETTVGTVTATLGGVSVPVAYSGLTPGLVALYQVNLQIPTGTTTGNAVPLVLTVTDPATGNTFVSNTVTVALQ
jgi:uncharacterized protein (TIGR03437 family)